MPPGETEGGPPWLSRDRVDRSEIAQVGRVLASDAASLVAGRHGVNDGCGFVAGAGD